MLGIMSPLNIGAEAGALFVSPKEIPLGVPKVQSCYISAFTQLRYSESFLKHFDILQHASENSWNLVFSMRN